MTTTKGITSRYRTADMLARYATDGVTVSITSEDQFTNTFTLTFTDVDDALALIETTKAATWADYMRAGGNSRNKRAHSTQFAAVKKAVQGA